MMSPKEKIKVHVQIVRENARKLKEWREREEIHAVNARLAEDEMRKLIESGIVA